MVWTSTSWPSRVRIGPTAGTGPLDAGHTPASRLAAIAHAVPGNDPAALLALIAGLLADGRVARPAPLPQLPTLVLAGADDPVAGRAVSWAESMPAGRSMLVPGRNHINAVTSGEFRRAAVGFLTG